MKRGQEEEEEEEEVQEEEEGGGGEGEGEGEGGLFLHLAHSKYTPTPSPHLHPPHTYPGVLFMLHLSVNHPQQQAEEQLELVHQQLTGKVMYSTTGTST